LSTALVKSSPTDLVKHTTPPRSGEAAAVRPLSGPPETAKSKVQSSK
jgi:hypothetical protein